MRPEELDPKDLSPEEVKDRSRGISRDMSPEAIARRLDIVSELRNLTLWLGKARKLGPVVKKIEASSDKQP